MRFWYQMALLIVIVFTSSTSWSLNGFDLSSTTVPADQIMRGGPPRDGIPAIDVPKFSPAREANWLAPDDRVIGVKIGTEAHAYPIRILNWHEIVNDEISGQPVVVTFCPLCGTGMVFSAEMAGETLEFGVSGLLFQSDVLLYDRKTESLWSQLWMRGVSGKYAGQSLKLLVSEHTSWQDWRHRNPDTLVLSRETGFSRDYTRNPYAGYEMQQRLYFPVENKDDSIHPKAWVLGVSNGKYQKAWTFEALIKRGGTFSDEINGQPIEVEFDEVNQVGRVTLNGDPLPVIQAFWFAWYAFYPESEVVR